MGLKKAKEAPSGVIGEYWKIVSESYDKISKEATCVVALYKYKASADAKKRDLGIYKEFSFKLTPEELELDRTALLYNKIKAKAASSYKMPFSGIEKPHFDPDLAGSEDL